ncbi:MAG: hypothetical protein IKR85_06885 [Clostridia bacterium]|nr:hypothetical protein [Clostridia bacterium]
MTKVLTWGDAIKGMNAQQFKASGATLLYERWCLDNGAEAWSEESLKAWRKTPYKPADGTESKYYAAIAEAIANHFQLTSTEIRHILFVTELAERLNSGKLPVNKPQIWEEISSGLKLKTA